jgi:glycerol-3-phosphate acyltransferase PlsY
LIWIALVVVAYLVGSIPFPYLMVQWRSGVDIRSIGSGNVGATNVLRVAGPGTAAAVLALDVAKGAVPVLVGRVAGAPTVVLGACALAAILGHVFPLFLSFRGGKGVATSAGAIGALSPLPMLAAAVVFGVTVAWKRIVSVGSMLAVASFPVFAYLFGRLGWMEPMPGVLLIGATVAAALILLRHSDNVRRLAIGKEHRLGKNLEGDPR